MRILYNYLGCIHTSNEFAGNRQSGIHSDLVFSLYRSTTCDTMDVRRTQYHVSKAVQGRKMCSRIRQQMVKTRGGSWGVVGDEGFAGFAVAYSLGNTPGTADYQPQVGLPTAQRNHDGSGRLGDIKPGTCLHTYRHNIHSSCMYGVYVPTLNLRGHKNLGNTIDVLPVQSQSGCLATPTLLSIHPSAYLLTPNYPRT